MLNEGQETRVEVVLIPVEPSAPTATEASTAAAPPEAAENPTRTIPPPIEGAANDSRGRGHTRLGWVLVGGGGVALVGAAVSAGVRAAAIGTIESDCGSHRGCDPALRDEQSRARTFGALGLVLGIAGAAAVGSGILVLSIAPKAAGATPAGSASIAPLIGPGALGLRGSISW